ESMHRRCETRIGSLVLRVLKRETGARRHRPAGRCRRMLAGMGAHPHISRSSPENAQGCKPCSGHLGPQSSSSCPLLSRCRIEEMQQPVNQMLEAQTV